MPRTINSPIHRALIEFLIEKRKETGLTQTDLAKKLGKHQSFIAYYESGQRRIDIVDLFELAEAIGFEPDEAIALIKNNVTKPRLRR